MDLKLGHKHKGQVLIVDDNVVAMNATALYLRRAGYEVRATGTCEEARREVKGWGPELVLLDVVLPDGNGVELCREWKRADDTASIYVLLLSSILTTSERQVEGLEAGADGYIGRPVETREILARVDAMFRMIRAEHALKEARETLSQRVEERTRELKETNRLLQQEIVERKQAEEVQRFYALRLKHLVEMDKAITMATTAQEVVAAAFRWTGDLLGGECIGVVKVDLELGRAWKLGCWIGGEFHPRSDDVSGLLRVVPVTEWMAGNTLAFGGGDEMVGVVDELLIPELLREKVGGVVVIPLLGQGQILGVMYLAYRSLEEYERLEHREISTEVAHRLAMAMQQMRLLEELGKSRERSVMLSHRLMELQESERRYMARELHDEIGQDLTGLKLLMDLGQRLPSEGMRRNLEEAKSLVTELLNRVRNLSLDLRPQILDDLGLIPALDWHFERFTKQTAIEVDFKYSIPADRMTSDLETTLYRIIQEAVTNVARHARVGRVAVKIWRDGHWVEVWVVDEGVGFDTGVVLQSGRSNGLSGMRERAVLLGGEFVVESREGEGAKVRVRLPIAPEIRRGMPGLIQAL